MADDSSSSFFRLIYGLKFAVALAVVVITAINATTYFNINANKTEYDNVTADNALVLAWFNVLIAFVLTIMAIYYLYKTIRGAKTAEYSKKVKNYFSDIRSKYNAGADFDVETNRYVSRRSPMAM
jgi:hypothetical protein